jgi:hypothetical protein
MPQPSGIWCSVRVFSFHFTESAITDETSVIVEAIVNEARKSMEELSRTSYSRCYEVQLKLFEMVRLLRLRYNVYDWSKALSNACTAVPSGETTFVHTLTGSDAAESTVPFGDRAQSRSMEGSETKKAALEKLMNRTGGMKSKLGAIVTCSDQYCLKESTSFREKREKREKKEGKEGTVPSGLQNDVSPDVTDGGAELAVVEGEIKKTGLELVKLLQQQRALLYPNKTPNTTKSVGITVVDLPTHQNERFGAIKISHGPVEDSVVTLFSELLSACNGTSISKVPAKQRNDKYAFNAIN